MTAGETVKPEDDPLWWLHKLMIFCDDWWHHHSSSVCTHIINLQWQQIFIKLVWRLLHWRLLHMHMFQFPGIVNTNMMAAVTCEKEGWSLWWCHYPTIHCDDWWCHCPCFISDQPYYSYCCQWPFELISHTSYVAWTPLELSCTLQSTLFQSYSFETFIFVYFNNLCLVTTIFKILVSRVAQSV
jgi:hypothetical protein